MGNIIECVIIEYVKMYPMKLKYITHQTNDICIAAVKQDGWALGYVKNQNNKICLEAVKQSGNALKCVKNQNDSIVLEAVKQDGWALQFVKNQNDSIVLEAVKQNAYAFMYVHDQHKLLNEFLKINHYIIYLLKDCNMETYVTIFRYLLNMHTSHEKMNINNTRKKYTIGYHLENHTIDNSFITIFVNFLIEQHEYNVLQTIRMEQSFYNNIKK